MLADFIDGILDKAVTQDFWRGILYLLAGFGVTFKPEYSAAIISAALGISGIVHIIWHKGQMHNGEE